ILPRIQPQIGVPVVVAQHMPKVFTESLAKRLSDICSCQVRLLDRGLPLKPGVIHLAPGGLHTHIKRRGSGMPVAHLDEEPKADLYRPSVDVLFETAADAVDRPVLGVVLTGIGHDGLRGAQRVCDRQGKIWSQCEESSVVYGMPKAVAEAGLSSAALSPEQLGEALANLTAKKAA
ncbi:MAG: CheB methylesterase domain-containing protein, partial [Planctomycetota bacterium]